VCGIQGLPPITEAELQSSESVDVAEQEELLNKLKEFGFEQVRGRSVVVAFGLLLLTHT
jgi:hypothetical protein